MGAHKIQRYRLTGQTGLLMHNGQLSDPTNEWAIAIKAIANKRKKTEADYEEMARLEWYGGLYLTDGKPCLPGDIVEATITSGARKNRMGQQAKAGILCLKNSPIQNGGTDLSDLKALWEGKKHFLRAAVVVNKARVWRTRPLFDPWSCEIEVQYDPEQLNEAHVFKCLQDAEATCDWRPKYGRFSVERI